MVSFRNPLPVHLLFVLLCYRETAAVDLNVSTHCNASLDISVAFNGRVTLSLVTDRRQLAHEFWLFDFESHADAYFLVGTFIRANRTGSCSNARDDLYWGDVFDEADELGKGDFDPVSKSGLLNTFTPGESWTVKNGETIRRDTLSFEGSVGKLLDCRSSSPGTPFVFSSNPVGEEVVLKTTAYATCVRPRVFAEASQGVYVIETAFPITIRVDRSLAVVGVKAPDSQTALSGAYYNAAFVIPVPFPGTGAEHMGSEYTRINLDFFTIARDISTASQDMTLYKMLNATSAVTSVQSSEIQLISPGDTASTADGRCYLQDNHCKQQFQFSFLLDTMGSLAKAVNSQSEANKRIDVVLSVSCDVVDCPGDVINSSCQSLGKMARVDISIEMSLGFTAVLSHDDPQPSMMVYGLRRQTDRVDVTNKLVSQGDKLILMSQIGPAAIRDDYNATLREFSICKGLVQGGCANSPAGVTLTYYDNTGALSSNVYPKFLDSYRIYEVYFPMRGLVDDDFEHTITAKYDIKKVDGTGGSVEFLLNQRVSFIGCPAQSTYSSQRKLCVCNTGYLPSEDTTTCFRDPSSTPKVTPRAETPSSTREPPASKKTKSGSVSAVVYLSMTLFMVMAAIYI